MSRDQDYPKKISKGFAGVPDNIDAAFVWSGNGKIYFFKVSSGVLFCASEEVRKRELCMLLECQEWSQTGAQGRAVLKNK